MNQMRIVTKGILSLLAEDERWPKDMVFVYSDPVYNPDHPEMDWQLFGRLTELLNEALPDKCSSSPWRVQITLPGIYKTVVTITYKGHEVYKVISWSELRALGHALYFLWNCDEKALSLKYPEWNE